MIITLENGNTYDTSNQHDISLAIANNSGVLAWYVNHPTIEPVRNDQFVGSVLEGGAVNFKNIFFNPHGNGTHTETVGHISKEFVSINEVWQNKLIEAQVVTLEPVKLENGDLVLDMNHVQINPDVDALIIRTLPNSTEKKTLNHSGLNSPYILESSMEIICRSQINHLLIDQPSVDREEDAGHLKNHHSFWDYPKTLNKEKTITELIYVPNEVTDGVYLLNLQVASFENDAAPSKPILYKSA